MVEAVQKTIAPYVHTQLVQVTGMKILNNLYMC